MRAVGTAHDEARMVELGLVCAHCQEPFVRASHKPVSCTFCFRRLKAVEREATPISAHAEATKQHFRNEAKKRKAK